LSQEQRFHIEYYVEELEKQLTILELSAFNDFCSHLRRITQDGGDEKASGGEE